MNFTQTVFLASGERIEANFSGFETSSTGEVDILHLIRWMNNNYTMPKWRLYVLYPDETINYEIPQEDIRTGGSFEENYQDGQRRSLTFTLHNQDRKYSPGINSFWTGTRLRLDRGICTIDGTTLWCESGIFVVSQAQNNLSPSDRSVQITAKDKFSLFDGKPGTLETTYEIPIGSEIEQVIKTIQLMDCGNGEPFDSKPMVFHSSLKGKVTQATISKSAGETLGSILLELATQLSAEIFYNAHGNLTIVPTNEVNGDEDKPTIYDFVAEDGDLSGLNFTFDLDSVINRVIVTGSSLSGGVVTAVAVNDDASSPLCYQRIGYRTSSVINDTNITTQYLAEERAQYELRKVLILKSSTSIGILFNPLLTVNNLITITSEYFGLSHERFLIQSISCPLDYSGSMTVTISNIKNLPLVI